MTILKKGFYKGEVISSVDFSNLNLAKEENTESLKFDKDEYLSVIEDAKKDGYDEGFKKGLEDGYNSGLNEFEAQKESLYSSLENDKASVIDFLQNESIQYINNFQKDIGELITSSINKIFLNCISNDDIMQVYLTNLLKMLKLKQVDFSIIANSKTISLCSDFINENNISVDVNNAFNDYDLSIKTDRETTEYFLKDEFEKIQALFK